MSNNLSRRGFLGSLAAVGAAGVVSVPALAQTVKAPAKWDKTVDFLIVGTGFAGLGAAIEAHEQGIKNILVIDKMPSYGGNSIINGGAGTAPPHRRRRCCCRYRHAESCRHQGQS